MFKNVLFHWFVVSLFVTNIIKQDIKPDNMVIIMVSYGFYINLITHYIKYANHINGV